MRLDEELSLLRKEISQFRAETTQRLEVIENEVNRQVSRTYNAAIIDHLSDATLELIDSIDCQEDEEMETRCKTNMADIQRRYLDLLKEGKVGEALGAMEESLVIMKDVEEGMAAKGKSGCASCISREAEIIGSNLQLLSQIQYIENPRGAAKGGEMTVGAIDPEVIHEEIINPLSNKTRLQILQSIYGGRNRFSDFAELTGQKGGQLLYHLKILLEHDFVRQYASKDYVVTKKGLKTLALLTQIYND